MATLLELSIGYALVCVLVAMVLCAGRLLIGPSAHDRVLSAPAVAGPTSSPAVAPEAP